MISPWSDGSAYDALVDDTCFPTIYETDEPALIPADARRIHFQDVAAGSDMAGATARERGDAAGTDPAPGAYSSLSSGLGVGSTNVSGARRSPGAA